MGNVLLHFSHEKMCRNIAALCGWDYDRTRTFLMEEGRQLQLERGDVTEEAFHAEVCHAAGRALDLDELRHAASDIFRLNESIVPLLHQLKSVGMRLVLLSNTSITHLRFIERNFSVLSLMDDRVTSFEAGALKPENRIYEVALSKARCDPHECFYTDDIEAYILKAATFGINARLFTSTEALRADLATLTAAQL